MWQAQRNAIWGQRRRCNHKGGNRYYFFVSPIYDSLKNSSIIFSFPSCRLKTFFLPARYKGVKHFGKRLSPGLVQFGIGCLHYLFSRACRVIITRNEIHCFIIILPFFDEEKYYWKFNLTNIRREKGENGLTRKLETILPSRNLPRIYTENN